MSAMLPCGNFGVYKNQDKTKVAVAASTLYAIVSPEPGGAKTSALAESLLSEMLDAVTGYGGRDRREDHLSTRNCDDRGDPGHCIRLLGRTTEDGDRPNVSRRAARSE
jgi:hypothetical protein